MASSTVPAVKAHLLSLFRQQADLTGVNIEWAAPVKDEDYTDDIVWLGDVAQAETNQVLGGRRRDEDYTVEIVAQAWVEGNDPQTTEERCWELRESIATAIRADLSLGGILNEWAEIESTQVSTRPANPNGWLAKATLQLRCRARI